MPTSTQTETRTSSPKQALKRKVKWIPTPNCCVRGIAVSVRIKVRDRKKPLVKTTGFTIYDDREVTLKRGMEIIEAERLNVHGYSRKRKSMQTLAEYFAAYKREYLKVERTPEEIQHYIVRLEHFFTGSADCRLGLDELTKKHCEDYIEVRRKTKHTRGALYAEGTIRVECEGIKALIEDAVEAGKIPRNPWKGVELPRQSLRERVLERWELDAIIERLRRAPRRVRGHQFGPQATGVRLHPQLRHPQQHDLRVEGDGQRPQGAPGPDHRHHRWGHQPPATGPGADGQE